MEQRVLGSTATAHLLQAIPPCIPLLMAAAGLQQRRGARSEKPSAYATGQARPPAAPQGQMPAAPAQPPPPVRWPAVRCAAAAAPPGLARWCKDRRGWCKLMSGGAPCICRPVHQHQQEFGLAYSRSIPGSGKMSATHSGQALCTAAAARLHPATRAPCSKLRQRERLACMFEGGRAASLAVAGARLPAQAR